MQRLCEDCAKAMQRLRKEYAKAAQKNMRRPRKVYAKAMQNYLKKRGLRLTAIHAKRTWDLPREPCGCATPIAPIAPIAPIEKIGGLLYTIAAVMNRRKPWKVGDAIRPQVPLKGCLRHLDSHYGSFVSFLLHFLHTAITVLLL